MIVVWMTGLPSSGKSTLAERLRDRLAAARRAAIVLDGDAMRTILGATGYDAAARDGFYRALAELAALIARQGPIVIVPATAPLRAHRALARELAPRFVEVYVDTPLAECARRDPKRLYAAAERGEIATLPGLGGAYEPPLAPDVIAHGGDDPHALAAIARQLSHRVRRSHDAVQSLRERPRRAM